MRRETKSSALAMVGLCEPNGDGLPWTVGISRQVLSSHTSRAAPSPSCALQGECGESSLPVPPQQGGQLEGEGAQGIQGSAGKQTGLSTETNELQLTQTGPCICSSSCPPQLGELSLQGQSPSQHSGHERDVKNQKKGAKPSILCKV